jgi:hypothetical protein
VPQVQAQEFEGLPLRVHAFLAGVPLHDVWSIDLPPWRTGVTLDEFLRSASNRLFTPSPLVRTLLDIRRLAWSTSSCSRRARFSSTRSLRVEMERRIHPNKCRSHGNMDRCYLKRHALQVADSTTARGFDEGQDNPQRIFPFRPETAGQHPEQLVNRTQPRPPMSPLQDGQLLPESEVLHHETPTSAKRANHGPKAEAKQVKHGSDLITDRTAAHSPKSLISKPHGIVTRDRPWRATRSLGNAR